MSERKIEIKIDPLGKPHIEAIGFHGQGCEDATRALEVALASGAGAVEREHKPEWNESEVEVHHNEAHH